MNDGVGVTVLTARLRGAKVELTQVAQRAEDLDRAVEFYTRLLGEGPVARFDPPGLAFFRLGGTGCCWSGVRRPRCSTCRSTTSGPGSRRCGPRA